MNSEIVYFENGAFATELKKLPTDIIEDIDSQQSQEPTQFGEEGDESSWDWIDDDAPKNIEELDNEENQDKLKQRKVNAAKSDTVDLHVFKEANPKAEIEQAVNPESAPFKMACRVASLVKAEVTDLASSVLYGCLVTQSSFDNDIRSAIESILRKDDYREFSRVKNRLVTGLIGLLGMALIIALIAPLAVNLVLIPVEAVLAYKLVLHLQCMLTLREALALSIHEFSLTLKVYGMAVNKVQEMYLYSQGKEKVFQ